jgi:hypothetical protein
VGTAQSCATMGVFGALMGLSVGAITGPMFAPAGHRLPVTIACDPLPAAAPCRCPLSLLAACPIRGPAAGSSPPDAHEPVA